MEDAVALALERNRKVLAARLDVDEAVVQQLAARIVPNPSFAFSFGNMVLGAGNPQEQNLHPSFFAQNIASYGLSQSFDVWRKRHQRLGVARQNAETQRLLLQDMLREVAYSVRTRFTDVLREQAELALAQETTRGYEQTAQLMRRREAAGDIARADLDKVELERLRYAQLLLGAERELADARQHLADVMAFADALALPPTLQAPLLPNGEQLAPDGAALLAQALQHRPDLQAARSGQLAAERDVAAQRRELWPDLNVGVTYTRSHFQISGDNPHALGVELGFDLPTWDRNQAGRAKAALERRRADNALAQLHHEVRHEVARAARAWRVAGQALHVYEDGGMLARAQRAREVAKRSFAAGATSLLELLEAERTYLETRADYLRTLDNWRQAHIDVAYATGTQPP